MATVQIDTHSADADHVLWFLEGNAYTQVIKGACELEVFDELVEKPRTAAEIAEPKDWSTPALDKLLSTCAAMKLVEKVKKDESTYEYRLLGPGRQLLRRGPPSLWGIGNVGGVTGSLANLADDVKKVKKDKGHGHGHSHGHDHSHGHGDGHGHSHSHGHGHDHGHDHGHKHGECHDNENKGHNDPWVADYDLFWMMEGLARCYMNALVNTIDCTKYKTAVDLGAGTGIAGVTICENNPHMSVTLVDGESILKMGKDKFIPAELKDRIKYLPGDMMKVDLPPADLYVSSMVAHHLSEEQLKILVTTLKDKLSPGGTLALFDTFVNEARLGPLTYYVWEIHDGLYSDMFQGRAPEFYTGLLQEAGYVNIRVTETQERCVYNVISGMKPN